MSFNFVEKVMCIGGRDNETPTLQFYKKGFVLHDNGGETPSWQDIILSGNTALTLVNAKANGLNYVKLFGACEQNGTPTPATPVDIVSNNGALKVNNQGQIYTDGTVETVTDSLSNTATAEMLLSVDDYQDEQEVLTGTVTRNVGVKVLDGSESWIKGSTQIANYSFYVDDSSVAILTDRTILSTHFQSSQTLPPASLDGRKNKIWRGTSDVKGTQASICVGYDFDNATVADFKQFLAQQYAAGTPVILVYPLAEPTTETVTGQTLTTKAGTNIVQITQASIDNLELEVSYKGKI